VQGALSHDEHIDCRCVSYRRDVWVPPVVQRLLLLPGPLGDVNADERGGGAGRHAAAAGGAAGVV
jgi:hypothetical protein